MSNNVEVGVDDNGLDFFALNSMLNLLDKNGNLQLDKDKEAAKQYFLTHVNVNTVFFHNLKEKIDYLVENKYYDEKIIAKYKFEDIKSFFKLAYSKKFRFETFLSAFKFYTSYALKTFDGKRYLERYEDRIVLCAMEIGGGDIQEVNDLIEEIISGIFQPATPTFLNAGKKQRGDLVSCYLMRAEDNMESICRIITSSLQLSKRGGGVAINLTNLREAGAAIKNIENQSSGIVPVMKILEDSFSYANQLGARQGAGAVYLHAHHPDIMRFLDTKRENADEKIRIKTLSLGIVVPDITFELAKNGQDMYLFSPKDVERVYGKPFTDISITEKYAEMVDNKSIRKKKISARVFFQTIAEIQFESGYPYLMFEDTVNKANPIDGRVSMSNLCTEILQVSEASTFNEDGTYKTIGKDISCNLGSLNIEKAMKSKDFAKSVAVAVRALSSVSDICNIASVPSIERGNDMSHAIGLGQMNLHGFFMGNDVLYGDEDSIEFTSRYFLSVCYHALVASNNIAIERGKVFDGFERSKYASGEFFDKYLLEDWSVKSEKVKAIFDKYNFVLPTKEDWQKLKESVMAHGIYNQNLQAVPPTGSISYVNNSTSSIHPIAAPIEVRKEGKVGRVYYPAVNLTQENLHKYKDAYEIGPYAIIDVYAAAQEHIDQGASLTLFFKDTATTRDINKAQIYAWKKGIKTLYYIRMRQDALKGTEVQGCVSCAL